MSYNLGQKLKTSARARHLFVAVLVLGCAFGTVTTQRRRSRPPPLRTPLPPPGNSAYLVGHAQGTQGYAACLRAPAVFPGPSTPPVPKRLSL